MRVISPEQMEAEFHEWSWQEQALALHHIHTTKIWRNYRKKDDGEPYESFTQYADKALHLAHQTVYKRIALASSPRFKNLSDLTVSINLAKSLIEEDVEEWVFNVLVVLLKLGVPEKEIQRIIESNSPREEAQNLATARRNELKSVTKQLDKLLKQLPGKIR
jgi:hypothetical protein